MHTLFLRSSASGAGSRIGLPADITDVVLRRIVILCLTPPILVALGNIVNLANDYVFGITTFDYTFLEGAHDVAITVVSLVVAAIVHRRVFAPRTLLLLGLFYCVFAALWFAAVECLVVSSYQSEPIRMGMSYFSFTLIWVVFFPAIVPMRLPIAAGTILLAASAALIPRWVAHGTGWVEFSEGSITFLSSGMAFSVLLGIGVSRVVYQLGESVSEAREMGSYRLQERIGSGGMGEVWVASHHMLARPAAVKFIRQDVLAGMVRSDVDRLNRRFEQEVQSTATLESPHTVDIYDYGLTPEGTFYYVMELLRGIDMDSLVARFGALEPERAVHLLVQACHSLQEAHNSQLIHRDIKPANLFVCAYGEDRDFVKVLDFGLVTQDDTADEVGEGLTQENAIVGTPAYMCPEAIHGHGAIDARSDLYSLGCVAYWLLTGTQVFTGDTPMAVLTQHATAIPEPPSRRTELRIPTELDEVVLACLAKDPNDRPQVAEELAMRLRALEFAKPWDSARARSWWERHAIGVAAA